MDDKYSSIYSSADKLMGRSKKFIYTANGYNFLPRRFQAKIVLDIAIGYACGDFDLPPCRRKFRSFS